VRIAIVIVVQVILYPSISAMVWGSSVKHQPQKVGKEHVLNDEDVVQLVKK
jgi:ribosome-interacting GTPase 1